MDLHRQALTRDGEAVPLSPRLVRILGHLASHPGKVFAKEALLDRFWADVHVVENTLDRAITRIRKALGDNPARPQFIQTVPRQGYRFIAAVDASGAPLRDAFDAWMKGRLALEALNAEQLHDATAAFERVLAEDGHYAPAHVAVANAHFLHYELTRPENTPKRALLERALEHGQRACVLDPSSGEAWATLGFLLTAAGDVEPARAAARRATALQPANWRHQFRLSMASWGQERLDAVDRTLALMPGFAPAYFVAAMVFVARQSFATAEELAAKGAARQSQDAGRDSPFPAFGLHWLLGLLQLRRGEIAAALESFDREVNEGRRTSIYFREYRVNALIGTGYGHLAANDPPAAIGAFQRALEAMDSNGRALLGLQQACARSGRTADAESLGMRVEDGIAELAKSGRWAHAAMLRASVEVARGHFHAARSAIERLLEQAPPGQTGWIMPIDPALELSRNHSSFEPVLALLSARAS